MDVPPLGPRHAGVDESLVSDRRQRLARIASSVTGIPAESRLLIGRPATVLIQEVLRSSHDLFMRSHARDLSAAKPWGAVDMELLRKCPCPVLLVRHGTPAPRPRVVAAVNASSADAEEMQLNEKIVEAALHMAQLLDSETTWVLHAWMPFDEGTIRSHSTDDQFAVYVEADRQRAAKALTQLFQSFEGRLNGAKSALRRGDPGEVIPQFVVAEGIDIVVMGSVARAGIAGLLIGNTAEQVLRRLPCSILTVKPHRFASPVRPDDS